MVFPSACQNNLNHGTKANILQRFKPTEFPGNETSSAIIIKLSAIPRCLFNAITFNDFAGKTYAYIIDIDTGYDPVDIVCDRYFENSLKRLTRHDRGFGSLINFDDSSEFQSDFEDNFMKNPKNKENPNHFLAKRFLDIHNTGIITVITMLKLLIQSFFCCFWPTVIQGKTFRERCLYG